MDSRVRAISERCCRVAALQQLASALAARLTQDVDSVLRDVRLWLAPPLPVRAVPPPPTPSENPLRRSTSEGNVAGAGSHAGRSPPPTPALPAQQAPESPMRTCSDDGSSDSEV